MGLVQVLRKIRYIVESTISYILTNYTSTINIAVEKTINTTTTQKLNIRLVRTLELFIRSNLIIHFKFRIENIIPNILTLLPIEKPNIKSLLDNNQLELDALYYVSFDIILFYQYTISLFQINLDFRRYLLKDYK